MELIEPLALNELKEPIEPIEPIETMEPFALIFVSGPGCDSLNARFYRQAMRLGLALQKTKRLPSGSLFRVSIQSGPASVALGRAFFLIHERVDHETILHPIYAVTRHPLELPIPGIC